MTKIRTHNDRKPVDIVGELEFEKAGSKICDTPRLVLCEDYPGSQADNRPGITNQACGHQSRSLPSTVPLTHLARG